MGIAKEMLRTTIKGIRSDNSNIIVDESRIFINITTTTLLFSVTFASTIKRVYFLLRL